MSRRHSAMAKHTSTNGVSFTVEADQPTIIRAYRSMTNATYALQSSYARGILQRKCSQPAIRFVGVPVVFVSGGLNYLYLGGQSLTLAARLYIPPVCLGCRPIARDLNTLLV